MFLQTNRTLAELRKLLQDIVDLQIYTTTLPQMSNATIGQHTRHIIELYQCMLNGYDTGLINYENRKRDEQLETNIEIALLAIKDIETSIQLNDKTLLVEVKFNEECSKINSTYHREVLYNLEHCIHHQALIKVALNILDVDVVSEQFGVAPATIKYRKQCVQ